jgi:hypothetical protein
VGAGKANASEPLMTCRKILGGIETGAGAFPGMRPGGCLLIGQVVSGMKVARARFRLRCGTWEPVVLTLWTASGAVLACGRLRRREPRAAVTVRGRVAVRGTGADRLVVAEKPGNAGGAKGTGRPGGLGGQPALAGRSR